jgi:hypothetical protein
MLRRPRRSSESLNLFHIDLARETVATCAVQGHKKAKQQQLAVDYAPFEVGYFRSVPLCKTTTRRLAANRTSFIRHRWRHRNCHTFAIYFAIYAFDVIIGGSGQILFEDTSLSYIIVSPTYPRDTNVLLTIGIVH